MAISATAKFSLLIGDEPSVGVAPTTWFQLQPNPGSQDFGNVVKQLARRPISAANQYREGATVDLDASGTFDSDLTMDDLNRFAPKFIYAEPANFNLYWRAAAMDATTGLQVPALSANQAGKLQFDATKGKTLIFCAGYANAGNNGLHTLATPDPVTTDTVIHLSGSLVTEASPPSNAIAQIAGIQSSNNDLGVTVSGTTATLTSIAMDFTTIGIFVGQAIQLGGTVAGTQFNAGANGVSIGRVTSIAAHTVLLDKLQGTLITTAAGVAGSVQLLYGMFIRNLSSDQNADDNRYQEGYVQFEGAFADLFAPGQTGYIYLPGAKPNDWTFDMKLGAFINSKISFPSQKAQDPTQSRKTGASTAVQPLLQAAFGAAGNIVSLRMTSPSTSSAYFHNVTLAITNNVNPEKVLGTLGALFQNKGIFGLTLSGEALFTDPAIIAAINNATTVTADFAIKNGQGGAVFDFPSLKVSGGKLAFPLDKSITTALSGTCFNDTNQVFNSSMSISLFPILQ